MALSTRVVSVPTEVIDGGGEDGLVLEGKCGAGPVATLGAE